MDITSITTALTTLKSASEIAKLLKDAGESLERAEFKLKLAELMEHLAETKMSLADVRGVLEARDREISELRKQAELQESVVYQAPYYMRKSSVGGDDGPFCQKCYDTQKLLVRLQQYDRGSWLCHSCQNHVFDSSYVPPPPPPPISREAIFGIY